MLPSESLHCLQSALLVAAAPPGRKPQRYTRKNKVRACPLFRCYTFSITANLLPLHPGTVLLGVLGRAPAGLRPIPGLQPLGKQRVPAASAQPQPHRPAEGAGGLRPVEDRAQQQRGWRRRTEVRRVLGVGSPALGFLAKPPPKKSECLHANMRVE